jgi:addiction module RelE/StbE family toxin
MAQKVIWSPETYEDLKGIFDFIARDSPSIAISFTERILAAIDRLIDFPLIGPRIREWKRSPYRHVIVYPCRIIYRVEEDSVILIAIVHGARDLKRFMRQRRR